VFSYMYAIPPGSSKFGGSRVAELFLDDWRLSGISTFATGGRGNISVSYSPAADYVGGGESCGAYNVVGQLQLPHGERTIDRWFQTAAIQPVTQRGDIGNACDLWKFGLPGFNNHDLSLFKDFTIRGNQTVQLRWEVYNLFDHTQFQAVNTSAVFNPNT